MNEENVPGRVVKFLFTILVLLMVGFRSRADGPYYAFGTKKCPKHRCALQKNAMFAMHGRDAEHDDPYCTSTEILLCKKCESAYRKSERAARKNRGKEEKNITPLPKACPIHGTTLEQHAAYGFNSDGSCDLIHPAKYCRQCGKSYP